MARWLLLMGICSLFLLPAGLPARAEQSEVNTRIAVLKTGDDDARQKAAAELVALGAPAVKPLLKVLANGDATARFWSAWALGRLKDSRAAKPLAAALKDDTDAFVRWGALKALGEIGGPEAVDAQIAALKDDTDPAVRAAALGALGACKDPRVLPVLLALLTGEDRALRGPAATALGAFGDPQAIKPLITLLLSDDNGTNQEAARNALIKIGTPAIDPLIVALATAQQPWQIIQLLMRFGNPAVAPLIAALKAPGQEVVLRRGIVQVLGQLTPERMLEWLPLAFADTDAQVRAGAVQATRRQVNDTILDLLLPLVKDPDSNVRGAVAQTIPNYHLQRALEAEMTLITDEDSNVRQQAAGQAFRFGMTSCVPALLDQLTREENQNVRLALIESLGQLKDARAVDPIIAALKKEPQFRWSYQSALQRIGPVAAPAVLPLLKEENVNVRLTAVVLVGQYRERKAIEPLIGLLEMIKGNDPQNMKQQIVFALQQITGQNLGQDAAAWRKWWEGQAH